MTLDALSDVEAARQLHACCGSRRWVDAMVEARPFGTAVRAKAEADRIWLSLGRDDWLEAFAHHPRIGEAKSAITQEARGASWSRQEQSQVDRASDDVKAALARVNEEYERRFGYIYIVCASGRRPEELLAIARQRLSNDPETEIQAAVEEQRKIMQLRLSKLLENP